MSRWSAGTSNIFTSADLRYNGPPPNKKGREIEKDKTGREIPEAILPLWDRAFEAAEVLVHVSSLKSRIKKYQDLDDPLFRKVDFNGIFANIEQLYASLKIAKPFAVCPACMGKLFETCSTCEKTGFVSQHFWENAVTLEDKDMRAKITNSRAD